MHIFKKIFRRNSNKPNVTDQTISMAEFRNLIIERLNEIDPDIKSVPDETHNQLLTVSRDDGSQGQCDLTNNYKNITLLNNSVEDTVEFVIKTIFEGLGPKHDVGRDDLFLLLRTSNYLQFNDPAQIEKISKPFCGELHQLCMADLSATLRGLTQEDIESLKSEDTTLIEIAKENTRQLLPKTFHDDSLGFAILFSIEDHAHLAPSLILFDEFWEQADKIFPDGCLIAIPRRDQLFLLNKADPNAISNVKQLIHVTFEDDFNLLTAEIYVREKGVISLLNANQLN